MGDDTDTGAILTPTQRKFLRGTEEQDRSEASARMTINRIQKRLRAATIEDVPLLAEAFDAGTIDPANVVDSVGRHELALALRSQIALVYRLARAAELDAEQIIDEGTQIGARSRAEVLLEKARDDPTALTIGEINTLQESGRLKDLDEAERNAIDEQLPDLSHGFVSEDEATEIFGDDDVDDGE